MLESNLEKRIGIKTKKYRQEDKKFIFVKIIDSNDNVLNTYAFSAIFFDEGIVRGHFSYTTHMRRHKNVLNKNPFFWLSTNSKIRGLNHDEVQKINDMTPWDNIVLIDTKNISKNMGKTKNDYLPTSIIKQKDKPLIECNSWYTTGPVRILYRPDNPVGFKFIIECQNEIREET